MTERVVTLGSTDGSVPGARGTPDAGPAALLLFSLDSLLLTF